MEGNKLDCCVVRDLLPAYVEELTEPETAEQVRSHLAECAACCGSSGGSGAPV